jgi:transposase
LGLAFVLTLVPVTRFARGRQSGSYLGVIPTEGSSGGRQRLRAIGKQGDTMMGWPLVEAAQTAPRFDPKLRRRYLRLKFRRGSSVAKVAIARQLAIRLHWKLRIGSDYTLLVRMQGSSDSTVGDKRLSRG